jgi:hypothetical protein
VALSFKPKEEELWKLKYFTIAKTYIIFPKKSSKRNPNPSRSLEPISSFNTSPKL